MLRSASTMPLGVLPCRPRAEVGTTGLYGTSVLYILSFELAEPGTTPSPLPSPHFIYFLLPCLSCTPPKATLWSYAALSCAARPPAAQPSPSVCNRLTARSHPHSAIAVLRYSLQLHCTPLRCTSASACIMHTQTAGMDYPAACLQRAQEQQCNKAIHLGRSDWPETHSRPRAYKYNTRVLYLWSSLSQLPSRRAPRGDPHGSSLTDLVIPRPSLAYAVSPVPSTDRCRPSICHVLCCPARR